MRGVVKWIIAGRAVLDVGNQVRAAIAEELTVENVPIERIVAEGQAVEGWYDAETHRVDVTRSLRTPAEAHCRSYRAPLASH